MILGVQLLLERRESRYYLMSYEIKSKLAVRRVYLRKEDYECLSVDTQPLMSRSNNDEICYTLTPQS